MAIAAITIIMLVFAVVILIVYNMSIYKKIQTFNSINQKITSLNVLQDFMNTIGETTDVDSKIKKINDILIEKYEIKYSTIVVFDGAEYNVKASNVDPKHWESLKKLQDVPIFKDSIATATPKYITVNNENERLEYQKMEFGRAKSAIFFPLNIDNVYVGYWIIESGVPHDFDNVDTTILEVVKDNIISVIKTVGYQRTIESIVRTDQFTGLPSAEYLYGEGRKEIDHYTVSTICMFKIANLERINKEFSRELGNQVVTEVSKKIRDNMSDNYIFVRYMGPKFAIAFAGVEVNDVAQFLTYIKEQVEEDLIEYRPEEELEEEFEEDIEEIEVEEEELIEENENTEEVVQAVKPKLNFIISSYYKGTGLEEVLKKLEEYLDNADESENEINSL